MKYVEQEVCKLNWDMGFVTSTMQEIGVQLPRLLEVYDQLFKARVQDAPSDKVLFNAVITKFLLYIFFFSFILYILFFCVCPLKESHIL